MDYINLVVVNLKCKSVDTLDCPPPPALPPRRPPWPPNNELSTATLRSIGVAAIDNKNTNNHLSNFVVNNQIKKTPPPPSFAPPNYPAPPRPPSRNGKIKMISAISLKVILKDVNNIIIYIK